MEHYKERDTESTVSGTGSKVTANGEKLKVIRNLLSAFSNFFLTIIEKPNIQEIKKRDDIIFIKDSYTGNFRNNKSNPNY